MTNGARLPRTGSRAARFGALAIGAALLAALIVPMLVVMLAGPGLDVNTTEGHAAGDAARIASAAVGGAQRLLAGGRDAAPVALPPPANMVARPADLATSRPAHERAPKPRVASTDAAAAPEQARRF